MRILYNIEPYLNKHLSCNQVVLATIARHYNKEYRMILSESFGFDYDNAEEILGVSISPGYQNRRYELFGKYHGFYINDITYNSIQDLEDNIYNYLKNYGPLMLKCDIFNCYWNMSYKSDHINHYILIVGYDENSGEILIIDPFTSSELYSCDISKIAFPKGIVSYFNSIESKIITKKDFVIEIDNTINHIETTGAFKKFINFRENFYNRINELNKYDISMIHSIPILFNLNRIMNQRVSYYDFLCWAEEYNVVTKEILCQMKTNSDLYNKLRIVLTKQIIKRQLDKQIVSICDTIANNEKIIISMLKKVY